MSTNNEHYSAELSVIIDAPADDIYRVLSDYKYEHHQILPEEHFVGYHVEQGGIGEGTVVNVRTRAFGTEIPYRLVVSEPQPGRLLLETDEATGVSTSFLLTTMNAKQTAVKIRTNWPRKPGVIGWLESLTTPPVARMIYKKELANLKDYMKN